MNGQFKQFKVYAPSSQKKYTLDDDGTLTITGVLSTTNKDLDGDIVSPHAIESLSHQAVGLNLHMDHNHHYSGGIGVITESYNKDNQVHITAKILKEYAEGILERLNLGMKFGFSVGGLPVVNNLNPQIIEDFVLLEVSLTLLPANWDTFGTVEAKGVVKSKCLTGACHYILKNSSDIMKKEFEENSELEQMVIDIVNEAFANKEQVIIDEFRNELKPIVAEIVAEEITPQVQEIVINYLEELFPPAEEEVEATEEEVDEEIAEEEKAVDELTETSETEEEEASEEEPEATEEEVVEEEIEEKDAEETIEEEEETLEEVEKEEATEEVEVPEEDEIFDEPLEIDIEKEEIIKTEDEEEEVVAEEEAPVEEAPAEEEEEEVIEKETQEAITEKSIELIVDRVLEKLSSKQKSEKSAKTKKVDTTLKTEAKVNKKPSKKSIYTKSVEKKTNNTFLNSPERDKFGRNKKYL